MKKLIKYLTPLLLLISILSYNQESASAATSESVFLGSSGSAQSKYVDASSKVYILVKNTGSVPIKWQVVNSNNTAVNTAQSLAPGAAKGVWVTAPSKTKHALKLVCDGNVTKCSATGNISLQ